VAALRPPRPRLRRERSTARQNRAERRCNLRGGIDIRPSCSSWCGTKGRLLIINIIRAHAIGITSNNGGLGAHFRIRLGRRAATTVSGPASATSRNGEPSIEGQTSGFCNALLAVSNQTGALTNILLDVDADERVLGAVGPCTGTRCDVSSRQRFGVQWYWRK
jgi:hypothetical protein